ncbi:MAG: DUF4423 domain-containing protein [Bacteriovorax sp.]
MKQNFIQLLQEEFELRQKRNPTYSLRALSRDLGIGLGSLSEAMNGKRELSKKNFEKALDKMLLSEDQKEVLRSNQSKLKVPLETESRDLLDENTFRLIADWHYLAILNLAKIQNNSAKPRWVAERLGIALDEAKEALKRLKKLGLLDIHGDKLVRTTRPLTTTSDIPSMAIRKHHLGNLRLAERALFEEAVERREFGSITMPTNPERLKKAKELLLKTRVKIGELLDQGETSEVYTLSFQLFPLTKSESEKQND